MAPKMMHSICNICIVIVDETSHKVIFPFPSWLVRLARFVLHLDENLTGIKSHKKLHLHSGLPLESSMLLCKNFLFNDLML